jgi:ribulose kinase
MNSEFVIGVDVGTGSVRAGIFTLKGKMVAFSKRDIAIWKPKTDFVEQSSENIWQAAAESVKEAVTEAHIKPEQEQSYHGIAGRQSAAQCYCLDGPSGD